MAHFHSAQSLLALGRPANAAPLLETAREAAAGGGYQAAQLGYYPVWSWLRVPVQFSLEN